jgi:O-antigen/teichoic acid export membrane protein
LYQLVSERIRRSDFFRNTAILSSGTAIAQAISIFTAPVLTRIYNPVDYGVLGVYMTFCALIGTVSTLHYSDAIVVSKDENEAREVLKLSWLINICIALVVMVVLLFLRAYIARLYNIPSLTSWLLLAPVSVFFAGLNTIFSAWSVRKKQFRLLSKNRIYTAFIAPFFSIILGFIMGGPAGLFIGLLVSQIFPTLRMSYYYFRQDELDFHFRSRNLAAASKRFRNFPRFSLPADFINNFSNQIPVLMLGRLGGSHVVGWYNLSVRILGLPSTLISTAVGDVFRQRANYDFHTTGSCRSIFLKVFKTLALIALVPFSILLLFGPSIFSFVFGEQWREAGKIAQVIGVLYVFKFVVSPLSYVTYVAGKQWVGLVIDVILLGTLLGLLYLSQQLGLSYITSLFLLSISYSLLYILTFYLSYKFTVSDKFI